MIRVRLKTFDNPAFALYNRGGKLIGNRKFKYN
jgi:hypothetical protein